MSGISPPAASEVATGRALGIYGCPTCGLVSRPAAPALARPSSASAASRPVCPRCATPLSHRRPECLQPTWAYTLAAWLLYGPANALPIMTTVTVFGTSQHTILGGIGELWAGGDWLLAVIVFVASIAVPLLKLWVLTLLAYTAQRRSTWRSPERARLYRLLQAVGHWSMLDVFVVVLLVGMVQFMPFAGVRPGPGLLAFGAVVVLSIAAAHSFDPRLIWPEPERADFAHAADAAPPPGAQPAPVVAAGPASRHDMPHPPATPDHG